MAVVRYNISERVDATELVEQCTASQREAGQFVFFWSFACQHDDKCFVDSLFKWIILVNFT